MKRSLIISTFLAALFLSSCANFSSVNNTKKNEQSSSNHSAELHALLDDIWKYELSQSPALASRHGVKSDRYLPDISPLALKKRRDNFEKFQLMLAKIKPDTLDTEDRITWYMQDYRLRNYIDLYDYQDHLVPITSEYGFHGNVSGLSNRFTFSKDSDYKKYINALKEVSLYFEQQIAYMKEGMKKGMIQPKAALVGFEDSVKAYIVDDITTSEFYTPFKNVENTSLLKEAHNAVADVNQAYQTFYRFLINDYLPKTKADISVKTWPKGKDFYQNRINYYTTTKLSAEDIHSLGLQEVARIRTQMQSIVDKLNFDGSINDFIQYLRTDPKFYAKTPEELIITASYIAKKMDARLPKLFKTLPRTPYGVEAVPNNIAPKYTTGRYIAPRRDDQPGYYWVNTYALDKRPLYALPALTLHEAVPGHHLQISLAAEMEALPPVRRSTYISAFGEGWGLYSEFLGLEVGMYDDPYDDFGRLSYEMWRACRLVVDTGMHMFGWTRQQALDYMLENTALSEHNVRTEVDRYITWPAQALSYKIGEIKIKQLREKAQTRLGDKFDLRDFHAALLAHGSVPLFVLEQNIDRFIAQTLVD